MENLIAELRKIGPHVIVERRPGGYVVDHAAARLIRTYHRAFNRTPLQGICDLPTLAEWFDDGAQSVFDGDAVRADRLAAAIENIVGGSPANDTELVLAPIDRLILNYLSRANGTVTQFDIDENCKISRRTAGPRLERLRKAGLTHRPNGPRGGEAITLAGRKKIAPSLPPNCPQAPQKNERIRP